jgi:integrase/recombinase XerD
LDTNITNSPEAASLDLPAALAGAPQVSGEKDLIDRWLGKYHLRSANTERGYAIDLRAFRAFTDKPLRTITVGDVQDFAESLAHLAPATQARRLAAIKSLISYGCRLRYLLFDVGAPVDLPSIRDRLTERILTEEAVHGMFAVTKNERNAALIRLTYAAGLRVSEVCSLLWRDLTPRGDAGQLNIFGKGSRTRVILLPKSIYDRVTALRRNAGDDDPVFRSRKHGALVPRQAHRIVKSAARRSGLSAAPSPHWLRHAHASHALDRKCPVHVLQASLGHASLQTTTKYAHARPDDSSARYVVA